MRANVCRGQGKLPHAFERDAQVEKRLRVATGGTDECMLEHLARVVRAIQFDQQGRSCVGDGRNAGCPFGHLRERLQGNFACPAAMARSTEQEPGLRRIRLPDTERLEDRACAGRIAPRERSAGCRQRLAHRARLCTGYLTVTTAPLGSVSDVCVNAAAPRTWPPGIRRS